MFGLYQRFRIYLSWGRADTDGYIYMWFYRYDQERGRWDMLWWLRPCNVYVRPSPPPKSTNYIVLLAVKLIIAHKIYPNVSLKSNCAFFLLLINILEKISCQIPSQLSPRKFQSSIWVERKKSYHGLVGGENTVVTQKTLLWVSRRKCRT